MPNYDKAEQTHLSEPGQLDQYQVTGLQVIELLRQLGTKSTIITAYFDGGRHYILTAVLGVLQDRELVVLDLGPDEIASQRALDAGRLLCTTRLDGITIRFTLEGLGSARYQGNPAISAQIPASAYRFQRRQFLRICTPTESPATCHLPLANGESYPMTLADISGGGIGLIDKQGGFATDVMDIYKGCLLTLPDFGELRVDLQVRSKCHFNLCNSETVNRYGMQFLDLAVSDNLFLQRYITKLQMTTKSNG